MDTGMREIFHRRVGDWADPKEGRRISLKVELSKRIEEFLEEMDKKGGRRREDLVKGEIHDF